MIHVFALMVYLSQVRVRKYGQVQSQRAGTQDCLVPKTTKNR